MVPRLLVPRPTPKTGFLVFARNRQVAEEWEVLLRTRHSPCTSCWDHVSTTPTTPIGGRYTRLKSTLSTCAFDGQELPQWQYEIDKGARVKIGVGRDFVALVSVSIGHLKENE